MPIHSLNRTLLRQLGLSGLFLAAAWGQTATTYTITTIAGNNTAGYAGDAGAATAAELSLPVGATLNGSNLYIADQANQRIRIVGSDGKINTFAGSGVGGYTGDGAKATAATVNSPSAVVVDSKGVVYFSDTNSNVVRKVTTDGNISTFAGNQTNGTTYGGDGGAATNASLFRPSGMAIDASGNIYIADTSNNAIRKIAAATGIITTIAGTTSPGYNGDNGPAIKAQLKNPVAVAVDPSGNIYIADSGNHVIRKVSGAIITTVAGNGTPGFSGDGGKAFPLAQLNNPKGVAVDSAGNVYISDTNNARIRVVSTSGIITTIAGNNSFAYAGDGGAALSASLNFPAGISMDGSGNIYVADTANNVIRLLKPASSGGSGLPPAVSAGGVITAGNFGASSSVAPGTWVEIYGSNLSASTRSWTGADFSNGGVTAPTSLDRTEVTIGGQQAAIDYISPGQVNVLVPFVNQGTVPLTVTTAVGTSSTYNLTVNATQFGVYAPPQFKVGGKQYLGAVFTDGSTFVMPPNSVSGFTSRQAHAGDTITIYGVGFGPVDTNTLPGQVAPANSVLTGALQVLFGTTPAVITYKGLAPGSVGLYQFNVTVPAVSASDAIPVTISLNGVNSSQTLYTAVQ
ncbi:MAG TPA: IPT/TIG domain-containing protein [Candidatus Sulfopaludibacter sp.]|nr:IPT/TIG domain-containing protein [Candidatus Sulfopaludibacter sp.]